MSHGCPFRFAGSKIDYNVVHYNRIPRKNYLVSTLQILFFINIFIVEWAMLGWYIHRGSQFIALIIIPHSVYPFLNISIFNMPFYYYDIYGNFDFAVISEKVATKLASVAFAQDPNLKYAQLI